MRTCLSFCLALFLFTGSLQAVQASQEDTEKAREQVLRLFSGEWVSRALYTAAKLEIADALQEGACSVLDLALVSGAHPESLQRVLHMLASVGVFEEVSEGYFANNAASALLVKNTPYSLHHLSLFYGEDIHAAWEELPTSILSGSPSFELVFQQPVFEYFRSHPERGALFQEAMREKSQGVIASALEAYDFGRFGSVCDIGGGYGYFLLSILKKYPSVHGILFDVPEVIGSIAQRNPELLKEKCTLVCGNFFEALPKNADAYLMKSVLHDWDDRQAEVMLQNCRHIMGEKSRLLLVEVVLLPKDQSVYANCMDLLMLAVTGGKERSLASFKNLLDRTGLVLERVYPTSTEFSILEVRKKL